MLYSRARSERNQNASGGSSTGADGVRAGSSSTTGGAAINSAGSGSTEREAFGRWRDRQYFGPRRWFQSAREDSVWEKDNGKCPRNASTS
jgi:E3 ubiquitin-protein ligase EDD1